MTLRTLYQRAYTYNDAGHNNNEKKNRILLLHMNNIKTQYKKKKIKLHLQTIVWWRRREHKERKRYSHDFTFKKI